MRQQAQVIEKVRNRFVGRETRHREREIAEVQVQTMVKSRGLKLGHAEYQRQREYPQTKPHLVNEEWCWPILLVYGSRNDLASQSDYLQSVAESVSISEIFSTVFDPSQPPPWDIDRFYSDAPAFEVKCRKVSWSAQGNDDDDERCEDHDGWRIRENDQWILLPPNVTVGQLIERDDYVIPLFPVLHVEPTGRKC